MVDQIGNRWSDPAKNDFTSLRYISSPFKDYDLWLSTLKSAWFNTNYKAQVYLALSLITLQFFVLSTMFASPKLRKKKLEKIPLNVAYLVFKSIGWNSVEEKFHSLYFSIFKVPISTNGNFLKTYWTQMRWLSLKRETTIKIYPKRGRNVPQWYKNLNFCSQKTKNR